MKLLDTSVAIDHLRGARPAVELLKRLVEEEQQPIASSEVVRFELVAGARDDEMEVLEEFCSAFQWVPVDEDIARAAGLLVRAHRLAHSGIGAPDYLIAATALVLDAQLLTTNVRHFPMLVGLTSPY